MEGNLEGQSLLRLVYPGLPLGWHTIDGNIYQFYSRNLVLSFDGTWSMEIGVSWSGKSMLVGRDAFGGTGCAQPKKVHTGSWYSEIDRVSVPKA